MEKKRVYRERDYHDLLDAVLNTVSPSNPISVSDLFARAALPAVSEATKKKHLKTLIKANPALLEKVTGFYPAPETIIDLVESRFGAVVESNIDHSNEECRRIVQGLATPIIRTFVCETLSPHISAGNVHLRLDELMTFLLEEFSDFARGAGNGLVSIAGSINERLLIRAMTNSGLVPGTHFTRTGTDSEADILIHAAAGTRTNLGVEIKSYHARERLLRGLRDITGPKVGAGFFKDASEFNFGRSRTLLQADPAAIYMPNATLAKLEPAAAAIKTNSSTAFQSRLYRPLEQFVTDARHYYAHGALPHY